MFVREYHYYTAFVWICQNEKPHLLSDGVIRYTVRMTTTGRVTESMSWVPYSM